MKFLKKSLHPLVDILVRSSYAAAVFLGGYVVYKFPHDVAVNMGTASDPNRWEGPVLAVSNLCLVMAFVLSSPGLAFAIAGLVFSWVITLVLAGFAGILPSGILLYSATGSCAVGIVGIILSDRCFQSWPDVSAQHRQERLLREKLLWGVGAALGACLILVLGFLPIWTPPSYYGVGPVHLGMTNSEVSDVTKSESRVESIEAGGLRGIWVNGNERLTFVTTPKEDDFKVMEIAYVYQSNSKERFNETVATLLKRYGMPAARGSALAGSRPRSVEAEFSWGWGHVHVWEGTVVLAPTGRGIVLRARLEREASLVTVTVADGPLIHSHHGTDEGDLFFVVPRFQ